MPQGYPLSRPFSSALPHDEMTLALQTLLHALDHRFTPPVPCKYTVPSATVTQMGPHRSPHTHFPLLIHRWVLSGFRADAFCRSDQSRPSPTLQRHLCFPFTTVRPLPSFQCFLFQACTTSRDTVRWSTLSMPLPSRLHGLVDGCDITSAPLTTRGGNAYAAAHHPIYPP